MLIIYNRILLVTNKRERQKERSTYVVQMSSRAKSVPPSGAGGRVVYWPSWSLSTTVRNRVLMTVYDIKIYACVKTISMESGTQFLESLWWLILCKVAFSCFCGEESPARPAEGQHTCYFGGATLRKVDKQFMQREKCDVSLEPILWRLLVLSPRSS